MSWILLLIAGLLEVAWAAGLKTSEGFTRLWPSVFTVVTALGSFVLLAMAMRQRDPGLVLLRTDPLMDPLRNEPRFQAIERQLKFPG